MKVIAALAANLEMSSIGTKSRLSAELHGVPVLRRTVERLMRAKEITDIVVLAPSDQTDQCAQLLRGTRSTVTSCDASPMPWASLVQTSRKWALDGWRGGLGSTTCFDEYTDCRALTGLLDTTGVDAVMSVSAAAPVVDPRMIDTMIQHNRRETEFADLTFVQAPPGLAGILLRADTIRQLAEQNIPVGWTFAYQPDNPRKDVIFLECCLEVPMEVRYAVGRCIADTDRSLQRLKCLLDDMDDPDAVAVGRWLAAAEAKTFEQLPTEVEIELTTDDPYPENLLRPAGSKIPTRGPISKEIVSRLSREATAMDDSLIVLGGFGDPLRHPDFTGILASLRDTSASSSGPFGLAVRSTGVDLTDDKIEAMIDNRVDILSISLDAWSSDTYGKLQSPNHPTKASLDFVRKRMERVGELTQKRSTAKPIVVPSFTKSKDNVHEMDAFYDGWIRKLGVVTIQGYSHYAGQIENRSVINMAPSTRIPCRRLRSRCMVLADGCVTACEQDFAGMAPIGNLNENSLSEIWSGGVMTKLRDAHRDHRYDESPLNLCAACDEWHRP